MSMPADDPVVEATIGERLRSLDIAPSHVALIARPGAKPSWAGTLEAVSCRHILLWPMRVFVPLRRELRRRPPSIVSAAEDMSAIAPALFPRRRRSWVLVLEQWGLSPEEAELRGRGAPTVRALRVIQRFCLRRADRVMTVSRRLAHELDVRGARGPVIVVPNFVLAPRATPTVQSQLRLAYVGGGQAWQAPHETLSLLAKVKAMAPDIDCVVATRDPALRAAAMHVDLRAVSLTQQQAHELIASSTAIVALRGEHLAVRVASPVKVAEAVALGSAIIATPTTAEQVQDLADVGAAHIVDLAEIDIASVIQWLRTRAGLSTSALCERQDAARQILSIEHCRARLAQAWREALP